MAPPRSTSFQLNGKVGSLPGAKDSCFLGGIVKYYERIKKEVIMTLYCTGKTGKGEKKIWLFVLGPDALSRNLPLRQSEVR